ncbi:recombinase RecT [Rhodobacter sp. NTK016B]|uniref:recombinase RecT n=1 Tax=Rhodobacter sp. NTK016B TaxID=2759676 RepID=UPI001A8F3D04|nr:recombinase RecT [Rhodobacter sp. NTK016B]MBN8294580.1 recombinase RecT [Rhodobacter sp. NTK016B]
MSNALLKTPLRQVASVRQLMMNDHARRQLEMVAANNLRPERLMRVMANAMRTTPKLADCEPLSFLGALMQCAALGLEPNTVLGHAYMIPFDRNKKINGRWVKIPEVQVVIGYKGLIDLARRSGHITSLSANIHYSDDKLWEYEEGTEARLRHRPGPQKGDKLDAYAIAKFKDGGHAYVVLPWEKVEEIRDGSQGYQNAKRNGKLDDTPWVKHEDEMAKKTAIRALAKYLPLTVEMTQAVEVDEARADFGSFALDSDGGVQIDGDDVIDGEAALDERAGYVDEPAQNEKQPAKRAEEKEPPKRQQRKQQPRQAQPPQDRPTENQPSEQFDLDEGQPALEQEPDLAPYERLKDMILGELADGADPAEIDELYEPQFDRMAQEAPKILEELRNEIEAYRTAGPDKD